MNAKMPSIARFGLAISISALTACAIGPGSKNEQQIADEQQELSRLMDQGRTMNRSPSMVTVKDTMYVAGNPFRVDDKDLLPSSFDQAVTFNQLEPVSFQELISGLGSDLGVRMSLSADAIEYLNDLANRDMGEQMMSNQLSGARDIMDMAALADFAGAGLVGSDLRFSISFDGTVKELLDVVTSKANLYWEWDSNEVKVFRLTTDHYVFDGDPSSEEFSSSINSARSSSGNDGGTNSTLSTTMTRSAGSIYNDMTGALDSMISGTGRFSISEQQGIITVTDTPEVHKKISRYVDQINAIVNKRINIRTEVYEIVSDQNGNFGIDWDAVSKASQRVGLGFSSNFNAAAGSGQFNVDVIDAASAMNGSSAIISALNSMADVSLMTSSTNFTTNGKPVPVQVANERFYIDGMTRSFDENGRESVSATQAALLEGFTMSLTPRINSNGKVDLQFAADMSQVNNIETVSLGDDSMIQLPDRTFKTFSQRVSVGSGSTVMLAGFERTEKNADTSSVAGRSLWGLGGSKGSGERKVMTLILLTPYVMAN